MASMDRTVAPETVGTERFSAEEVTRYDRWTIRLHWLVAVIVVLMWIQAQLTGLLPKGPLRLGIWSCHVLLGFALAAIITIRIVWRLTYGNHIAAGSAGPRLAVAKTVHVALYCLLIVVVILGVANVFGHGFPLFGNWKFPRFWDKPIQKTVHEYHEIFANILISFAFLHTISAFYHHYIIKDGLLLRMTHGR